MSRNHLKKKQSHNKSNWIISQFYPPDYAATGQLLNELAIYLSKRGLLVNIFTSFPFYAFSEKDTLKKENYRSLNIYRIGNFKFIKKIKGYRIINGLIFCFQSFINLIFRANKKDTLIYTTEPAFLPLFAYLVFIFKKSKYILIIYDLYPDIITKFNILKEKNFIIRIWRIILRSSYRNSSKIIVLSESMKEELNKNYLEFSDKVEVISSWADHKKIIPIDKDKNWFAKKHGLVNKFVILYSGNQGRCHDFKTIINAAKLLNKNIFIKFVFIGNGAQNNEIKNLVKKLSLNNFLFLPYQKYENLQYSLNSADLALVSLNLKAYNLITPSKLYGHLAASTPIAAICPKSSYLYKIVNENNFGESFKNGDYIKLKKWIEDLYKNKKKINTYREHSRKFLLDKYNKNYILDKYYSIISNS